MSDSTLRALRRRWLVSGSDHDQMAWLAASARQGVLGKKRLHLLAYLGVEGARLCLPRCSNGGHDDDPRRGCRLVPGGGSPPEPVHLPGALCVHRDLDEFMRGLAKWGHRAVMVGVLAAAKNASLFAPKDAPLRTKIPDGIAVALNMVQMWLDSPTLANRNRCLEIAQMVYPSGGLVPGDYWWAHALAAVFNYNRDQSPGWGRSTRLSVNGSAALTSPSTTHSAMLKALRAWSLNETPD